jgi:hypothetical protein
MKLEFLEHISEHGKSTGVVTDQLVRLFDFDRDKAKSFKELIQRTIIERGESLDLTKVQFIDPINCNLTLRLAETSIGIITGDKTNSFCELTINEYENMVNLLNPFCVKESNGYQ